MVSPVIASEAKQSREASARAIICEPPAELLRFGRNDEFEGRFHPAWVENTGMNYPKNVIYALRRHLSEKGHV
ncbi:MAG: hypothetical protein JO134_01945 [Xanthobacteraceae bacterium]|nr:hypothetical protein [Xanthobacteraceae bacterium]MBV9628274.1 hypothetical protein [Xanthobacteraceae bacterium]